MMYIYYIEVIDILFQYKRSNSKGVYNVMKSYSILVFFDHIKSVGTI